MDPTRRADRFRLTLFGHFVDPATERDYLESRVNRDSRHAMWMVVAVIGLFVLFIPSDWQMFGPTSDLAAAVGVRLLVVGYSILVLIRLRRTLTPTQLSGVLTVWAVPLVVFACYLVWTRPVGYVGNAAVTAVGVVLIYTGIPLGLGRQSLMGLSFTIGYLGLVVLPGWTATLGHNLVEVVLGLIGANGVGLMISRRLHATNRDEFTAYTLVVETRNALEKALQEVRTLQGLLPICSYCKQIRDDRGNWSPVEHYVHAQTGAKFTHGICPTCLAEKLAETEAAAAVTRP